MLNNFCVVPHCDRSCRADMLSQPATVLLISGHAVVTLTVQQQTVAGWLVQGPFLSHWHDSAVIWTSDLPFFEADVFTIRPSEWFPVWMNDWPLALNNPFYRINDFKGIWKWKWISLNEFYHTHHNEKNRGTLKQRSRQTWHTCSSHIRLCQTISACHHATFSQELGTDQNNQPTKQTIVVC